MGVHGLNQWVDEHGAELCNLAPLPPGTAVLVDGNGLAYFMLRCLPAAVRLGDYEALDDAFSAAFDNLRQAGLAPTVFLDGPGTRLKAGTLSRRRRERADQLERLHAACLDGACLPLAEWPPPKMMLSQLEESARAASVPVVTCEGEADRDIAEACASAKEASVVLAHDSDFFLFKGVSYVRFNELQLLHPDSEEPQPLHAASRRQGAAGLRAHGRVWTRSLLCELSELSESQVLDWAAILGNDATHAYPMASFGHGIVESLCASGRESNSPRGHVHMASRARLHAHPHPTPPPMAARADGDDGGVSSARPDAEAARLWLLEQQEQRADGWLGAAAEPALQLALEFSRDMYVF